MHLVSFENPTEDSELIQSLLLVKCFSQDEEARRYIIIVYSQLYACMA